MILQALTQYYLRKIESSDPDIAPAGWISKAVDYVIILDKYGNWVNLEQRFCIENGKIHAKSNLLPAIGKQAMKHTNSGKDANLLWDNASFVFGTGIKGELKRYSFIETFNAWFQGCDDVGIQALVRFYQKLQSEPDLTSKIIEKHGYGEDFEKRDPLLTFQMAHDDCLLAHRIEIKNRYELLRREKETSGFTGTCLVSGIQNVPIAINETVIKGIHGGQSSGANLISFNERSFESYGKNKRGGENAPVSKEVSFFYTTALNHLLRRGSEQKLEIPIGKKNSITMAFWAEKASDMESRVVDIFGEPPKDNPDLNTEKIKELFRSIQFGRYTGEDANDRFYVLGLSPNAARIAVRFWKITTVGDLAKRIVQYFKDIRIEHSEKQPEYLPLSRLLKDIAVQGKNDNIPPNLAGNFLCAILDGTPYPRILLSSVLRRIRAEQSKKDKKTNKPLPNITYERAALIKAYINRTTHYSNPAMKEELTVSLDPKNTNAGYCLGRLFAMLEKIQEKANPGINATIRDRYYGSASSTPVTVFPTLIKLSKHHLSKIGQKKGLAMAIYFDRMIGEIVANIDDFPPHLSLEDQGRFAIGYYHQIFTKHDNETNTQGEDQ